MPPSQRRNPGLLAILAYRDLHLFEYAIAVEVFMLERPDLGVPWYHSVIVAAEPGPIRGIGGTLIRPTAAWSALAKADTIIVPGWVRFDAPIPARLAAALRAAHARGARIVSICSGAYVLADAGLLDGRRATTHWMYTERFRARFPRVQFDDDVLYVDAGNLITSAGSAAGIDACLHLVRRDFGVAVTNKVARRMVCAPHREGGQAQYVECPVPDLRGRRSAFDRALDDARRRLDEQLGVAEFARRALMSERSFTRHFHRTQGLSPGAWLARERVARARQLLEASALPLTEVGRRCGYGSPETFRSAFRRAVGVAPGAYRARFGASRRPGG